MHATKEQREAFSEKQQAGLTLTQQIHAELIAEGKMNALHPKHVRLGKTPEALLAIDKDREHGRGVRCHNCGTVEHSYRDDDGKLWLWCADCKHRWRWHSDAPDGMFKAEVSKSHILDVVSQYEDVTPDEWQDRAPPGEKQKAAPPTMRNLLVAQRPTGTTPLFEKKPWQGVLDKKPWEYRATAVIPHRNTPDLLELCIRFLDRQTERPYIMVVDTGSDDESFQQVLSLRSPSVEIHQVACHGVEDYADAVCYAMDLAMSACRTDYLWCLHSDCFVVNPNMLEELLAAADGEKEPVIGYESSSANRFDECKGMVSHTCTLLHMPTMHELDVTWSRRRLEAQASASNKAVVFDPEMALNYRLREWGIKPLILGPEQAGGVEIDTNRVHLRSATTTEQIVDNMQNTRASYEGIVTELWNSVGGKPNRDEQGSGKVLIAPLRVVNGAHSSRLAWEGGIAKKPWQYRVTAAIPVLDTPEELALATELLRLQTERPYIIVVDTGSRPENIEKIEALRAEDLEIHYLRFNSRRHPSDFPAVAMDLAFAAAQTDYVLGTHADVFFRRRDLIEWLLTLCPSQSPAVGYEITERPHDDWVGMLSHTCSMYYLPKLDDIGFHWNFRKICRERGVIPAPDPLRPNWPDTELPGNYALRKHWIQPHLIGTERNHERTLDANIDHCRSLTAGLIYSPEYYRKASAWSENARQAARERIQQWKREDAETQQTEAQK